VPEERNERARKVSHEIVRDGGDITGGKTNYERSVSENAKGRRLRHKIVCTKAREARVGTPQRAERATFRTDPPNLRKKRRTKKERERDFCLVCSSLST